ncbi:hypothetical protein BKP35_11360 [Anaerobacillus arseniciselenatis]|uniref:Calcineurin-like phosphoesterase domain-containing protein n=1 Tax=Anaerobacillus arseniciselenatis TaxID=85682 RepID=A0A1S2LH87_9BACI|nr:DNA repair exonuclease [Anaerobacillus arseniciselenatis]OIJ11888.1 hypothetical protein BKP35_11360 [Anaerobacillus arseniciselenatis]
MKKIRFIHGADLHLDSPFRGLKHLPEQLYNRISDSTFKALEKLVWHAINNEVDFVILAGDLFDGENRSLKAQSRLKNAMEQLSEHKIACYIVHGNHDHLKGNWIELSWPNNVFFYKDSVEFYEYKKEDLNVHIYGYSYPEKSVKENIALKYEKTGNANFHIGILHGTAEGQEEHDLYAPFAVKQLKEKDFDYWALGHIHKRQVLHKDPYICYAGNIQGRHKKELGEKGVFLVELDDTKSSAVTFLPTSEINWEEVTVSIEGLTEVDELKSCCEEILDTIQKYDLGMLLILRFIGSGSLHNYLVEQVDELIDVLNMGQEDKVNFTFIIDKKIETIGEWDREKLKDEQHLLSDIVTVVDRLTEERTPLNDILNEAYANSKLRSYLEPFDDEEQKQLLKEAEHYVLATLLKERDG